MKVSSIILFLFLISSAHLYGDNYYFSSVEGDDTRTSVEARSPFTPWRSLGKLNKVLKSLLPGDSILFKRGEVFHGAIHITQSGTDKKPIVFGAFGDGESPIITSLITLDDWIDVGGDVYASPSPLTASVINVLLLDDTLQEMGRFPNSDSENDGYLSFEATRTEDSITDDQLPESIDWTGGELVIRKSHFTIDRHVIKQQKDKSFHFEQKSGTYNPTKNFGYFIQNHPKTLDRAGEWYYDPQQKRILIFLEEMPGTFRIEVSTIENLVTNLPGISNVMLQDLHFKGANGTSLLLREGSNITIQNCVIEQSGENGFSASNFPGITLLDNRISYSFNNGIDLGIETSGAKILSNVIECTNLWKGMGQSGIGNGLAIQTSSDHNLIEGNTILKTGYIGIRFSGNYTKVLNNYIDEYCLTRDDGAGIYTWTGSANTDYLGREIKGNIIVNGIGAKAGTPSAKIESAPAEGIYLDDNASGVLVSGNTVAHVAGKGIYIHNARDIIVEGNTIFDTQYHLFVSQDAPGSPVRGNKVSNNIFYLKHHYQKAVVVHTNEKNMDSMISLDKNYYVGPQDHLSFKLHEFIDSRRYSQSYTLEKWQNKYHKDLNSQKIELPKFDHFSVRNISENKFPNGEFEKDINGLYCFSPTNDCEVSWNNQNKMDGGGLQVVSRGLAFVIIDVRHVEEGKQYMLRFSAHSDREINLETYLRQSASSYHRISPVQSVEVTRESKEYEILIPFSITEINSSIVLESGIAEASYWIDDLSFTEVEVGGHNSEQALFYYNTTSKDLEIPLEGDYVDVRGNFIKGNVTLYPYSSVILLEKPD